jgi:predicted nucleic acid-binding protein
MALLIDTSIWSLALRRDGSVESREVIALREALDGADSVVTTGLVLQELVQGFSGPKAREAIIQRFGTLPLIQPDRQDHLGAAEVRNVCRRNGVQVGTMDAVRIQLCGRYERTLLSVDKVFVNAAPYVLFKPWGNGSGSPPTCVQGLSQVFASGWNNTE